MAAYWPDTCFTVIPDAPWSEKTLADMGDGGTPIPPDFLEYAALAEHEQSHWIQANAFSYGRFLSRIDHSRSEIAESFLGMFTPEQVEALTFRRSQGDATLQLDARQRTLRRPEFGPIGMVLQQHWWSLNLLRHELETSDRTLASLESSAYRYGLAVLYDKAGPFISKVAMLPQRSLREIALDHAPLGNYSRYLARCAYPTLSSTNIAECHAVLNQHWSYAHSAESFRRRGDLASATYIQQTHVRSWESKERNDYGNAFHAFALACPALDLNTQRPLLTLGIICCIALDGNYAPEVSTTRPSWLDIAPPLRFLRLAKAVRQVGVVPCDLLCELSPERTRSYCDDLISAAGLPETSLRNTPHPAKRYGHSATNSLRILLHDAYIESVKLRQVLPAALIAPSETAIFRAEELTNGSLKAHNLARLPPLLSIGGHSVPIGISDATFSKCAIAGANHRLLGHLIGNVGPMSFDGLPYDSVGIAAAEIAVTLLQERIERPVSVEFDPPPLPILKAEPIDL
ncbi:hypothetical protein [Pseudomonas syringae]|uniref:hypothetical protein n=1 Tax=Pseudomonas syringae TaxID=317 RepID=UPI001111C274|nr:hypothetical protein [Pseudomonas syringae]